LENVKQARVHLVLPESSLFKRDKQEATAAVTLTMKPGNALDRQQIIGVQRLVGASVAGLDPSRVIITDQRGVTLSASDPTTGTVSGVEARLELQQQVEAHIAQKIGRMLDSAYGPGQAIISVAAVLSFDASKTTTQDLLPVKGSNGAAENGMVRKRQTITGSPDAAAETTYDTANGGRRSGSTLEVEYEYGRRVEEVIAAPGAVKRITVGVIVPPRIGEDQQRRIKEFVQVAAGIDELRGDIVSIQSLTSSDVATQVEHNANGVESSGADLGSGGSVDGGKSSKDFWTATRLSPGAVLGILLTVLVLGGLAGVALRGNRPRSLTEEERAQMLKDVRRALGDDGRVATLQAKQS
jgi:flagellar M-ring protein FliF